MAVFRLFGIYQLSCSVKIRAVLKEHVKYPNYNNYTTEETPHQGTRVLKVLNWASVNGIVRKTSVWELRSAVLSFPLYVVM